MNKKYKSKCQLTFLLQTKILLLQFYRCSIGAQRPPAMLRVQAFCGIYRFLLLLLQKGVILSL